MAALFSILACFLLPFDPDIGFSEIDAVSLIVLQKRCNFLEAPGVLTAISRGFVPLPTSS